MTLHGRKQEQGWKSRLIHILWNVQRNVAPMKKRSRMQIVYDAKTDLLYIRLDDRKQSVINRRVSEDIVLDVGAGDKIVGIEILDASKHLSLERLLPVSYRITHELAAA
jgi:uncharacterized protein YuzE